MTNKTTFLIPLSALSRELSRSQSFDQPFTVLASAFRFLFFRPQLRPGEVENVPTFPSFSLLLGGCGKEKGNFLPSLHRFVYDQIQNNGIFAHERI